MLLKYKDMCITYWYIHTYLTRSSHERLAWRLREIRGRWIANGSGELQNDFLSLVADFQVISNQVVIRCMIKHTPIFVV